MTPEQKAKWVEKLESDLNKCQNEIRMLEASSQPPAQDCSLEPLTKSELMGEINRNITRLSEAQNRREKLQKALVRTQKEGFGLCESCGEPIAYERLELMPEATQCVACLQEKE